MERIGQDLLDQSRQELAGTGEKSTNARDLLSLLVKANLSDDLASHQRLSDKDVIAQVPTFITAGHETTR
jgi:cytochrome P450